ncbi:hypothetical protein AVEN_150111-1 [Araneus ventricosus]|uniref:Uncharacterized protein n=1 Tax=Araneus ventricosus TaxID=182803 RepID=A0A4Y2LVY8_ARAVE|nr:hypothetical protein AVEN_150111-1 [Araneus ventricosus]
MHLPSFGYYASKAYSFLKRLLGFKGVPQQIMQLQFNFGNNLTNEHTADNTITEGNPTPLIPRNDTIAENITTRVTTHTHETTHTQHGSEMVENDNTQMTSPTTEVIRTQYIETPNNNNTCIPNENETKSYITQIINDNLGIRSRNIAEHLGLKARINPNYKNILNNMISNRQVVKLGEHLYPPGPPSTNELRYFRDERLSDEETDLILRFIEKYRWVSRQKIIDYASRKNMDLDVLDFELRFLLHESRVVQNHKAFFHRFFAENDGR